MTNLLAYLRLVRASALYDLIATAAFVTPWTYQLVHQLLSEISPLPPFEPLHMLFVNLMGSIVVVWSLLRVLRPQAVFGLADAAARALFFTWQLYYLLAMDGAPVVWLFAVPEFVLGVAQGWGYWRLHKR